MRDTKSERGILLGVQWESKEISLSSIDVEASLHNQARLNMPLVTEHVEELALAILDGADLYDVVVYQKGKLYIIIDGNHRVAAYFKVNDLGLKKIDKINAYVVTAPEWKIDVMTRMANVSGGLVLTQDEKLAHAMHIYLTKGMTKTEAAKVMRITPAALGLAVNAALVKERLTKLGCSAASGFPVSILSALYRIKQDDALTGVALLAIDAKLSAEEVAHVSERVRKAAASVKQQASIVQEFNESYKKRIDLARRGVNRKTMMPVIKLRHGLNEVNGIRVHDVYPLDLELRRRCRDAMSKLQELLK